MGRVEDDDGGDGGDGATRLCIVTRERHDPARLIRFAASPDGTIVPDVAAKLPGRGAWVLAERSAVEAALMKGVLAGALKTGGSGGPAMEQLDGLLLKRCQETLSIGRRSGLVLGGGGKIRAAGLAEVLIVAGDASPRETRALKGDVDHEWAMEAMSGEEIGAVFGRPSMAFAAVLKGDGRQTGRIGGELGRLARWRGKGPEGPGEAGK